MQGEAGATAPEGEYFYIYAVDAASGEIIWRRDTISQENAGRNGFSPQGYILASDHSLHDGIPVENITTMFQVGAEYGRKIYA